jgi:hypothetical protein
MYGIPCCSERIENPDYDDQGNALGTQNNESCIIPKGCSRCIITKTVTSAKAKSTSDTPEIQYNRKGFCIGSMHGFPCCNKTVTNPEYDGNGYPYGTENGKSCVR